MRGRAQTGGVGDRTAVETKRSIRTLWPLTVPLSPPDDTPVAARPLENLSFAVNYAIHGTDVVGYHIGNLFIHMLVALAQFALVRDTVSSVASPPTAESVKAAKKRKSSPVVAWN